MCLHDGEIWIAGKHIIKPDEFLDQYSTEEFEAYVAIDATAQMQTSKGV